MTDFIQGKSYLKGNCETRTQVIKENKYTILHHICRPPEAIPPPSKKNLVKNKASTYSSTNCALQ